jgi:SNF2 family DNA or RNA helicase
MILSVSLQLDPPAVVLRRDFDVPGELWKAIGRNIAPGTVTRSDERVVMVPVDRFLASRKWLGGALTTFGCEVQFDTQMDALLSRADAERDEVDNALRGLIESLREREIQELLGQTRFTRQLRDFQLRDLGHVLSLSHGANFSVPGSGKTTVTYALYEIERLRGRVDRMLVVAPLSAFDSWFEEADESLSPVPVVGRFEDRVPRGAEIVLVNYQRLASRYHEISEWVSRQSCQVVLDEAHRMKRGRDGEWGAACLDLANIAVRRDILTGTPAPQHPSDFLALLNFLWPHQATRIMPSSALQATPSTSAMYDVSTRLRPLFARTKKDELGLEVPHLRVELVTMKPLQAEIYSAMRSRIRNVARSATEQALLRGLSDVTMYLLEAATNPGLLASAIGGTPSSTAWPSNPIPIGSDLAERILSYGSYEMPRKFEKLAALVAENAARDRKTLVWSNFVTNIAEISERVLTPFNPAVVHGGIPSRADASPGSREYELNRFRNDSECMVLVANPAAMSEGISLHHTCHEAIYVDRTFNAGQYLQSLDRIHRLGLIPGVETRITFLVSEETIDEIVDSRVRLKAERLSQMLSDPNLVTMALPDDEAYGEWIDADDVEALLGHLNRG